MEKSSVSEGQRYFDKRAAASYLNCHPRYLERAVGSGKLKALKPSGNSSASGWPISTPSWKAGQRQKGGPIERPRHDSRAKVGRGCDRDARILRLQATPIALRAVT